MERMPASYLPAGHKLQTGKPGVLEYEPGRHGIGSTLPGGEYVPAGVSAQSVSEATPVVLRIVPAGHGRGDVDPVGQKPPGEHSVHSIVPLVLVYVPFGQRLHSVVLYRDA